MDKYLSRLTSSARGETFNPLIYPALIATLAYGLGFTVFAWADTISHSSLYNAMIQVHPIAPAIWGFAAITTIIIGFTFLLFNIPPAGKISGLIGFMLWVFAAFCWWLTGGQFLVFAVALPNLWFWIWQYLSLSRFKREEKEDAADYFEEHGTVDPDL